MIIVFWGGGGELFLKIYGISTQMKCTLTKIDSEISLDNITMIIDSEISLT